jgi:NADH-quinone oxidoreductase subunit A
VHEKAECDDFRQGSTSGLTEYIIIGVFALTGLLFAGAAMVASRIIAPKFPDRGKKLEAYESGEDTIGSARIQFKVGYYLFALVFLVFDVEAVFLFPVLSVLRSAGDGGLPGIPAAFVLLELIVFVAVLAFALAYAWRKKVLEWE